jgi:hypothetical protein
MIDLMFHIVSLKSDRTTVAFDQTVVFAKPAHKKEGKNRGE